MRPEEFENEMRKIFAPKKYGFIDTEWAHIYADRLMWNLLVELAYLEGVEFMKKQELWYA